MKKEWIAYLEALGATDILRARVEVIAGLYGRIGLAFDDIFISDYVKEDGTREFESLWLFGDSDLAEAKSFLHQTDIDFARFAGKVTYWHLTAESYNFRKAAAESRLKAEVSLLPRLSVELRASGANCDSLLRLVRTRFRDQLVPVWASGAPLTESDAGADLL